ncbi:MAG: alpha/beta hydrolase [Actinomycetota bacterium]|nr:alpha/beta hydrolase [Actinomycetota bacterium]
MTTPWLMPPVPDRERFALASNARLADDPLPPTPPIAAPPAPGGSWLFDDRGVFVREMPYTGHDADPSVTLYIHGLAGSSTNFDSLATMLAGHTRGYAVDLPGFGRSDPPPGGRYSLLSDAKLMADVLDRISPDSPVQVIGNSLGGMTATALAARHPARVRTLTLISPAVPDLRMTTDRGADPRLAMLLAPGTLVPATRRLSSIGPLERARGMAALCYGNPSVLTDADIDTAAADLGWRYQLPWGHASTVLSLRALMRSYLRPGRWSFRAAAAAVTVPTLVIWGTKDRLVDPALSVPTAAAFADSRLLVISGCGHVAQMEAPATTARAVLALWQDAAGRPADSARGVQGVPCGPAGQTVATSSL